MNLFHRTEKRLVKLLTQIDDRNTMHKHSSSKFSSRFSQQFGKDHGWLAGQKMLFEFDSASSYEMAIKDFVLECEANGEAVIVFTEKSNPISSAIQTQKNVKILYMTSKNSAPKEVSENAVLVPWGYGSVVFQYLSADLETHINENFNVICSNLSSAILTFGLENAYRFVKAEHEMVTSPKITHMNLLNVTAHDSNEVAAIEGLFNNILIYDKHGLRAIKLAKTKTKHLPSQPTI